MYTHVKLFLAVALGIVTGMSALAAGTEQAQQKTESIPDKSGYTLFNPTPIALMRDFDTDRPDQTESPHTVDAGHFQIEADLFNYTHDHEVKNFETGAINLKAGLLNNVDLQLIFDGAQWQKTASDWTSGTVT